MFVFCDSDSWRETHQSHHNRDSGHSDGLGVQVPCVWHQENPCVCIRRSRRHDQFARSPGSVLPTSEVSFSFCLSSFFVLLFFIIEHQCGTSFIYSHNHTDLLQFQFLILIVCVHPLVLWSCFMYVVNSALSYYFIVWQIKITGIH